MTRSRLERFFAASSRRLLLHDKAIIGCFAGGFGEQTIEQVCEKVRGWMASANAAYRFVLIGMSFLLTNIWQELQEQWTRKAQVGRASWNWRKFRLKRFVNFLRKAIEKLYGMVSEIEMLN